MLRNPLVQRVLKNTGYLFGATGAAAMLGMVQGILVARMLGVKDYGILSTITLFTSVINNLVSFRMSELVIKYVGQYSALGDEARAAAVFKLAALVEMGASLVAFGLLCLLAPLGASLFAKDPDLSSMFVVYGVVLLANLIAESSTGLLQIFDQFRRVAVLNLVGSGVTLALVCVAYWAQAGLFAVLLAYLAGKSISALGLSLAALVESSHRWGGGWWRSSLHLLRPQRRELARFAVSTNLSASISLLTKDSEVLWVSLFRGPVEAGYYKLALTLTNLVQMPVSPLPQASYPEFSRQAAHGDWERMRYLIRQGSLMAGSYALFATLFLLIAGKPLIAFLYTPQYLPAYPALIILLLGMLVADTLYWRRPVLLALGRADFPVKVNAILAVVKVAGVILLVPVYGYLASAWLLTGFYWASSAVAAWMALLLIRAKTFTGIGEHRA
jgi:O-antigen/teichoic acid export membrane protein